MVAVVNGDGANTGWETEDLEDEREGVLLGETWDLG